MAGQDQNNSNQNGIKHNNKIEPTEQTEENVVEGKHYSEVGISYACVPLN